MICVVHLSVRRECVADFCHCQFGNIVSAEHLLASGAAPRERLVARDEKDCADTRWEAVVSKQFARNLASKDTLCFIAGVFRAGTLWHCATSDHTSGRCILKEQCLLCIKFLPTVVAS